MSRHQGSGTTATATRVPSVDEPSRRRVRCFRVVAALTGAFFLFLAVSNALTPWFDVTTNPDDTQPELHLWFTAMSGGTDLIGAGCLLALAIRPRGWELLAVNMALGLIIAGIIIVPFTPSFLILLVLFVPVVASYPYRRALRPRDFLRPPPALAAAVAGSSAAVLTVLAGVAIVKQITGTDSATVANWWVDYAEHAMGLAAVSVLAVLRGSGWRPLCALCTLAWLYLGIVSAFVIPEQQAGWGRSGGLAALAVGAFYAWTTCRHEPLRESAPALTRGVKQGT